MRFRQVHLDFHTSELISGIGANFSRRQFQRALEIGCVDSITLFAKCHHGWAYFPASVNETHPGLSFDLLSAQMDAAREIGVRTPVYISAGLDEKEARRHTGWVVRNADESTTWAPNFQQAGYHVLCFNSPYLDLLARQTEEILTHVKPDGVFFDISTERICYCQYCREILRVDGQDVRDAKACEALGRSTYARYVQRMNDVVRSFSAEIGIFHNSGHIRRGRRDLVDANTHLELESLPTGGWGYDHFPLSARYAATLDKPYLGMTGKFHTSWGEFGGYKHPNALRYEAAVALANGARMSIGDQLHPLGQMDEATYGLIGAAYAEVRENEAWCVEVEPVADIALLSQEAVAGYGGATGQTGFTQKSDAGAVRMLLEGHFLFDVIDTQTPLDRYRVIVLPDNLRLTPDFANRLAIFTASGGRILATGSSGLYDDRDRFALDLGVEYVGSSPYRPDYVRPAFDIPSIGNSSFIMYGEGHDVVCRGGKVLADRVAPYFNRDVNHFCSHQHAPPRAEACGPGIVESPAGIYVSWAVFEDYATTGSIVARQIVAHCLNDLLPAKTVELNGDSQMSVTLGRQRDAARYVLHLVYGAPIRRGEGIEVIEDLPPVHDTKVVLRIPETVTTVRLVPSDCPVTFEQSGGVVEFVVEKFTCHQMVEIAYQ